MNHAIKTSFLAAYLTGQPWGMFRPTLEAMTEMLGRFELGEKLSEETVKGIVLAREERKAPIVAEYDGLGAVEPRTSGQPLYRNAGGVAVVPVHGTLSKYAGMINGISQPSGMSFDDVGHAVCAALNDPRVSSVVMDFDTPGGTVAGGMDVIGRIRQARAEGQPGANKPLIGFAHDLCCSMGYLLGSQCDELYATENATVGSIGVLAVVDDTSKITEARGIKRHVIGSGARKGDLASGAPIDSEALGALRKNIAALGGWMCKACLVEGRSMDQAKAETLATGEVWTGGEGKALGLIDDITTLGELVGAMQKAGRK